MPFKDENLRDQFEQEIWLYIDEALPPEKMAFWKETIRENEAIRQEYASIVGALESYDKASEFSVDEARFEKMIAEATQPDLKNESLRLGRSMARQPIWQWGAGLAVAAAMLLFLIRLNHVDQNAASQTDWYADELDQRIDALATSLATFEFDDVDDEISPSDEAVWPNEVEQFENNLQSLQNTVKTSL